MGQALAGRLGRLALGRGYAAFTATMLPDNRAALGLMHKMSPHAHVHFAGGEYAAFMPLARAG